jgi:MerR family transcriptional regulator, heat shock protein HspR
MNPRRYEMALLRDARSYLTLEGLASSAGIHPALVERLIEFGLVEPVEWAGAGPLFDVSVVPRLRVIERLRCDLGINLAGIGVILEMIERLRAVQCENDRLRSRL